MTDIETTDVQAAEEPVSGAETKIAEAMAAVRAAVARASSHNEFFAGIEALLRHMTGTPAPVTDAERNRMTEAQWADLSDADKALAQKRTDDLTASYQSMTDEQRGDLTEDQWFALTDEDRAARLVPPEVAAAEAKADADLAAAEAEKKAADARETPST